jgi:hypothetical protein
MASSKEGRVYSQEEVNAILSRAVEQQSPTEGLTHEELLDTAMQAGISREAVEAAAQAFVASEVSVEEDRAVTEELAILRRRAWRGLFAHFVVYASVNALLVALNVLTSPFPWALIPALAWGVAIALHVFAVAFPNPRRAQRVRDRVRQREQKARQKRERERLRQSVGPVGESAKELGLAIERGVATMFAAAAKRIHQEVARAEDPRATGTEPIPSVRVGDKTRVAPDADAEDPGDEEEDEPSVRHNRRHR